MLFVLFIVFFCTFSGAVVPNLNIYETSKTRREPCGKPLKYIDENGDWISFPLSDPLYGSKQMPPGGVLWIKATRVHQDGDPDEILAEIQFTRERELNSVSDSNLRLRLTQTKASTDVYCDYKIAGFDKSKKGFSEAQSGKSGYHYSSQLPLTWDLQIHKFNETDFAVYYYTEYLMTCRVPPSINQYSLLSHSNDCTEFKYFSPHPFYDVKKLKNAKVMVNEFSVTNNGFPMGQSLRVFAEIPFISTKKTYEAFGIKNKDTILMMYAVGFLTDSKPDEMVMAFATGVPVKDSSYQSWRYFPNMSVVCAVEYRRTRSLHAVNFERRKDNSLSATLIGIMDNCTSNALALATPAFDGEISFFTTRFVNLLQVVPDWMF